jgi:hypothetical protein
MKVISINQIDPHGISAVVMQGGGVVVRYSDGKESVAIEGVTTSQVMKYVERVKNRADSAE